MIGWPWLDRRQFLASLLPAACTVGGQVARAGDPPKPAVAGKSLDRMIGQMLVVGFWGSEPGDDGARSIAGWLAEGKIGGVIFFSDNLTSPDSVRRLTDAFIRAAGPTPPLLCVDQEGGKVSRLHRSHGFGSLPSASDIATGAPDEARKLYDESARELAGLRLNVNFGPVVDLAVNPDNTVIEGLGRSYGADPAVVKRYASIFIESYRRQHVLTALKHFPGHGSATEDSHGALPDITAVWTKRELVPFADLIKQSPGVDMVMVGHLVNSTLFRSTLPASLSRVAIETVLRGQLAFDGVVVTDDMNMGAIRNAFSPEDAITKAVDAGADLLIYSNREYNDPEMPDRFIRVIRDGIAAAKFSAARFESTLARLHKLKSRIA